MKVITILAQDEPYTLLKTDATWTPYVLCMYYDPSKPTGQQWDCGHYFTNIIDAVNCFACKTYKENEI